MEQIINNLLIADNEIITKATADLQEAFTKPESIPALCDIVVTSANPQVRQYSAVLLKKRLGKYRNWFSVHADQQLIIKNGMLQALINEPEKSVRNAIAGFVGILIRHEFPKKDPWMNDVLKFILESCGSNDPKINELGSSIFAVLTDTAPDQFIPHIEVICNVFTMVLVNGEATGNLATPVVYNMLVAMSHLVQFTSSHPIAENTYQNAVPYIVKSLQCFALQHPDKFNDAFDILDILTENAVKLITPNLKLLIEFCLEVAHNNEIDDSVRVKCVAYIGYLVRLKKKLIIKQKLIEPIIQVLFNLMAAAPDFEDDEEEEYFTDDNESSTPMTCATQTMDLLALHVPPEKLIPPLLALLEPALKGNEPLPKKAAYLSIAVIAEGCSESICAKYLRPLLDCVKTGIMDSNTMVRNAALFALGQFSEYLQPQISQHASEVLPILFDFLHQICSTIKSTGKEPKHIDRIFYALETFCENLEESLLPHLPVLMERLFEALDRKNTAHLKELALSAITATSNAAKENMLPYFPHLIEELKLYLIKTDDEDICAVRSQALDCLAALARTIGKENFLPLAVDTMNLGLTLMKDCNDPELRTSCYNLFAAMSEVLNEGMASVLPELIEAMLTSVKSTEGIVPEFKDDDTVDIFEPNQDDTEEFDIENSDNEDDDDDDIAGYSVENAYMAEKEEAIVALKDFAEHTGSACAPYMQSLFEEIYKLINYPNEDIRKVSVQALAQFVISLYKLNNVEAVQQTLLILIPKLSELIRADEERVVVMAALDAYNDLLKELKSHAVQIDGQKDAIFACILDVLNGKVACQFDEPSGEEDEDESEYDEAIIESAGDILPRLGLAIPKQEFALYFGRVWPTLVKKIEKSKKRDTSDAQRSFAFGVLSECFAGLKEYSAPLVEVLLPLYIGACRDECDEVRNNVVYGLGELVYHADEPTFSHFPQILAALSDAVSKEKHAGTLDNILGALSRMVVTKCDLVPLNQVLPVFVQYLPLREDFEENFAVFRCIQTIYQHGDQVLVPFLEKIIAVGLEVLYKKQYPSDETRDFIFTFIKQVRQDFPDKFNLVANSSPEMANFVLSLN